MFSSPCSLRSSTCATLIALAAAAGISRCAPAPAKPAASLRAIVSVLAAGAKRPSTPAYPFSIAACAHASPLARRTLAVATAETLTPLAAAAPAAGWSPVPPALELETSFFDWVHAVPTARQHSHPYAVGPPARGIDQPRRAAGNALPGDSSARRSQVSRIARVFISFSPASLRRGPDSGPRLPESISAPVSARRVPRPTRALGGLEFLPPSPRPFPGLSAPTGRRAAFISP